MESASLAPAPWVPWEIWLYILDRPELKGCSGILRMVCKDWKMYIKNHKTNPKEAVRSISLLSFSLSNLWLPKSKVCQNAATEGHLHGLQWARENGCPWNEYTCAYALRGGHLYILTSYVVLIGALAAAITWMVYVTRWNINVYNPVSGGTKATLNARDELADEQFTICYQAVVTSPLLYFALHHMSGFERMVVLGMNVHVHMQHLKVIFTF